MFFDARLLADFVETDEPNGTVSPAAPTAPSAPSFRTSRRLTPMVWIPLLHTNAEPPGSADASSVPGQRKHSAKSHRARRAGRARRRTGTLTAAFAANVRLAPRYGSAPDGRPGAATARRRVDVPLRPVRPHDSPVTVRGDGVSDVSEELLRKPTSSTGVEDEREADAGGGERGHGHGARRDRRGGGARDGHGCGDAQRVPRPGGPDRRARLPGVVPGQQQRAAGAVHHGR